MGDDSTTDNPLRTMAAEMLQVLRRHQATIDAARRTIICHPDNAPALRAAIASVGDPLNLIHVITSTTAPVDKMLILTPQEIRDATT